MADTGRSSVAAQPGDMEPVEAAPGGAVARQRAHLAASGDDLGQAADLGRLDRLPRHRRLKDIGVTGQSHVTFDPDEASLADSICGSTSPKPIHKADPDDVRALVFTSGTTGPPKDTTIRG